jgi:hypothetical protein
MTTSPGNGARPPTATRPARPPAAALAGGAGQRPAAEPAAPAAAPAEATSAAKPVRELHLAFPAAPPPIVSIDHFTLGMFLNGSCKIEGCIGLSPTPGDSVTTVVLNCTPQAIYQLRDLCAKLIHGQEAAQAERARALAVAAPAAAPAPAEA